MERFARWIRVLFVAMMFFTCAVLCWYAATQYDLRFQVDDLTRSLGTSRQRETKQQYEYDQVVAKRPLVEAELAVQQPLAAAAQAKEAELRAQRKALRSENAELAKQLEALLAEGEQLEAQRIPLQEEVEALRQQEKQLQELVQSMGINTPGV